ncbi:MAG: hypothetical protein ABIO55_14730 [Ginsengibacter sp.]
MHNSSQETIRLLKTGNLKVEDLVTIAEEYPYYSLAQFRLLSAYKKSQHKHFEKQAGVTSLFFNNPKWLSHQLYQQSKIEDQKNTFKDEPDCSTPELDSEKKEDRAIAENKNEEDIAFEPLYTVDYFASQGIKINEDVIKNDKLGTQLKSFTEWLKSMKKIHSESPSEGDEQTDKIIRNMAETSNTGGEIVTEAMAEVLLKQGKTAQAIDIYEKLSLNNPSGSAYFAAKIKRLKSV